jgi:uncharacterized protein (TIGR04255 family)
MKNPLVELKAIKTKLRSPPLERTLAALSFTPILRIAESSGAGIADFQEMLRSLYPLLELEHETQLHVQMDEGSPPLPELRRLPVWRLSDLKREWRISLTSDSVALEVYGNYDGRDDFVARLLYVANAVEKSFRPAQMTRMGFRYLNVFDGEKMAHLSDFVRPELVAFGDTPYFEHLHHSTSIAQFQVPEGTLLLKHGILAPGMIHEFMSQPIEERCWFLDVDVSCTNAADFVQEAVRERANALTKRTGTLFNWAVTSAFMEAYDANQ